jgi:hypothetical protein
MTEETSEDLFARLRERARAEKTPRLTLTPAQLDAAEARLKLRLPPLLRRFYIEIGPGFGPGDQGLLSPPSALLPGRLFPLCDWGSGIQSALDVVSPDARIVRLDPNMPKADVPARVPAALHFDRADAVKTAAWTESPSLTQWLTDWLDGVPLFYAAYRGANDEDDDLDDGEEDGEEA